MNLKVVVDCANGATYHIAPNALIELGADVIHTNVAPNGMNINHHCGSNHPDAVRRTMLANHADIGIAFDGDGDRVIMIDEKGEVLDGDDILYILVKELMGRGKLSGGVVISHMSNLGLEIALNDLHVPFSRVPVGDQNIIHEMKKMKWELGGEPSGHIICLNINTTGDGIIAALQVLHYMCVSGKSLHELKQGLTKCPQKILNIPYDKKIDLEHVNIVKAVAKAHKKLGKHGRILIRYSGTEPVIRIMVEGQDKTIVDEIAKDLKSIIEKLISS